MANFENLNEKILNNGDKIYLPTILIDQDGEESLYDVIEEEIIDIDYLITISEEIKVKYGLKTNHAWWYTKGSQEQRVVGYAKETDKNHGFFFIPKNDIDNTLKDAKVYSQWIWVKGGGHSYQIGEDFYLTYEEAKADLIKTLQETRDYYLEDLKEEKDPKENQFLKRRIKSIQDWLDVNL